MTNELSNSSSAGTSSRFEDLSHLIDTPTSTDEISGKSHSRTAETLIEIVLNEKSSVRAIGLEGSWGSGKSSVIGIASQKMSERSAGSTIYHTFTFDVWAHQGDPLRRAFLDKFINWLCECKRINSKERDHWIDQVQSKVTKTTTFTEPNLKFLGGVMLLLAPILPLIYIWLSPFAFGAALNSFELFGLSRGWYQNLFLLLLAVPYIVVFGSWFIGRGNLGKAVLLLSRESDTSKTNQVIRDEDPTAVEFGNFLNRIIKKAANADHKLLIVIDNIDRLPDEEISDAWAMMRGLIGKDGEGSGDTALGNVWLIVPYDINHLTRMLDGKRSTSINGVIEKTFDTVLRVAPPLIVHWRDYFSDQLEIAFKGSLTEREVHLLLRLVEYEFVERELRVTPRSIKAYINGIINLVIQWREEIPIECVALYTLRKDQLNVSDAGLKQGSLINDRHRALLGSVEWQKYLSALHYNVSVEDAYQVLIGQDIAAALSDHDADELNELSKNPGFDLVLGELVDERATNWATESGDDFALRCLTIHELTDKPQSHEQIWNSLCISSKFMKAFEDVDESIIDGLVALVRSLAPSESWEAAQNIRDRLCGGQPQEDDFELGEMWTVALDRLNEVLLDDPKQSHKLSNLHVPNGPTFSCGVVSKLRDAKTLNFDDLRIAADKAKLSEAIVSAVKGSDVPDWIVPTLTSLVTKQSLFEPGQVVDAVQNRLQTNSPDMDTRDMHLLLDCLHCLEMGKGPGKASTDALQAILNDGTLLAIFAKGCEYEDAKLTGLAAWSIRSMHNSGTPPAPSPHPHYGDMAQPLSKFEELDRSSEDWESEAEVIADTIRRYNRFNELRDVAIKIGNENSIYTRALHVLVESKRLGALTLSDTLSSLKQIEKLIGQECTITLVGTLGGWSKYVKKENVEFASRDLLKYIHKTKPNDLSVLFDFVEERLKAHDQAAWLDALKTEGQSIELLLGLLDTVGFKSTILRNALKDYWELAAKGEAYPKKQLYSWYRLPSAMATQSRKAFYRDLMLWFQSNASSKDQAVKLFDLFPKFVDDIPPKDFSDVIVSQLLVHLINGADEKTLDILSENEAFFAAAISSASSEMKELASESLEGAISSDNEEVVNSLKEIAKSLGLKLGTAKPKSDEKSTP